MAGAAPPAARRRLVDGLFEDIAARHPRSLNGVQEARAAAPDRYPELADTFLGWAARAWGGDHLPRMVDAFVRFTTGVNMAQARYERAGRYENKTFQDCLNSLYNEQESMDDYLLGVYLTNFLWAHHAEICFRYIDHFLKRIPEAKALVEIAPGHGGWGALALKHLPDARLLGYDISPSSIRLATELMNGAGYSDRARYELKDALDLDAVPAESADAVICNFLIEHLEQPQKLFAVIRHLLKPGGQAFLTGALTAAQVDHIYEFRRESELVRMAEDAGLRVTDTFSGAPRRTLPNARFLPRSMLLVMQRRRNDIY
jgi:2-polyprenyl-3-methyl-5-hydroxy-6-metoxy-1,4-benzoquinol methylase